PEEHRRIRAAALARISEAFRGVPGPLRRGLAGAVRPEAQAAAFPARARGAGAPCARPRGGGETAARAARAAIAYEGLRANRRGAQAVRRVAGARAERRACPGDRSAESCTRAGSTPRGDRPEAGRARARGRAIAVAARDALRARAR